MSKYLELKAELATLDLKIELALAGEKAKAIRRDGRMGHPVTGSPGRAKRSPLHADEKWAIRAEVQRPG